MAVTVGLDIGSTGIRAVALDTGKAPPLIRRAGAVDLPLGAVVAGEIVDGGAVSAAISRLWKTSKLPKKRVVIGIANQRVIVRQVDVPLMSDSELVEALPFQVQEYIPMPVDEAILDYVPLGEFTTAEGEPMLSILAVAAQRSMIQEILDVVRSAGLTTLAVDLQPFGLVRAVFGGEFDVDGSQAIVDIGGGITQVVLLKNGLPRFVRILPKGGDDFTAAVVERTGMTPDGAEAMKRRIGVDPGDGTILAPTGDEDEEADARSALTAVADSFIDEIRGSVNFYLSQSGEEGLTRLVVAGNGARLPHLANRLGRALDAPVEPARVLGNLDAGKLAEDVLNPLQPVLPIPVGLALWGT